MTGMWVPTAVAGPGGGADEETAGTAVEGYHRIGSWVTCWREVLIDLSVSGTNDFAFPAGVTFTIDPPVVGHSAANTAVAAQNALGGTGWPDTNRAYKKIVIGAFATGAIATGYWRQRTTDTEARAIQVRIFAAGPGSIA